MVRPLTFLLRESVASVTGAFVAARRFSAGFTTKVELFPTLASYKTRLRSDSCLVPNCMMWNEEMSTNYMLKPELHSQHF